MDTKICSGCKETKDRAEFGTRMNHGRRVCNPRCKPCRVIQERAWQKRNPEKIKAKCKRTNARLKLTVFQHYGMECACCGEKDIRFFSIDHINGNGAEHRRDPNIGSGTNMYAWLIRNHFPPGFQTLCYQCNLAKHFNKFCPHQEFDVMTMVSGC